MKCTLALLLVLSVAGAHNHSVLKAFATGVISGVLGPEATVPDTCFDADTCMRLEDSLIRAFTDLVRGNESLAAAQVELVSGVQAAVGTCGFDTCADALSKWSNTNEQMRLALNVALTYSKGYELLSAAAEAAGNYHWEDLGYNLGKYWKTVNEGSFAAPLFDMSYLTFVEGAVLGLSRKQVETHPCFEEIKGQSKHLFALGEALYYSFVLGDDTALEALKSQLSSSTSELYKACKIEKFMENVVGRLKSGSYTSFGSNIMMNMSEIRKAYEDMKVTCGEDSKGCGMNVGKIVRLLLGWSI